ncbi:efflux RND transporter permease subunit, partial [Escherichia coli]|nr:efflux RND transporter permease subunit [Escherichia coli]
AMTAFVVPVLAQRWVTFDAAHGADDADDGRLARGHAALLDRLSMRPWLLAVIAVPLLVLGYVGYANVPTGFMPKVDEGGFVMDYYTPPGTSLDETERRMAEVDALLRADPDVLTFS